MNYDRKARLIADFFYKLGPNQDALSGLIAAALREAAAEAFEEAAKYHQEWADELKPQVGLQELPDQGKYFTIHSRDALRFRTRAAAPRPAPGERGKGK